MRRTTRLHGSDAQAWLARQRDLYALAEPEPRITPAMVKRLKRAVQRGWGVLPGLKRETYSIIDEWAARENARKEKP